MQSGTWESTQIVAGSSSTSIRDFIATWMKSPVTSVRLTDSCIGAQCNPTCRRTLLFTDPAVNWGKTIETVIIVLSLVITVTCFGLKSIFMLYLYYLTRKQKQFLNDLKTSLKQDEVNKIFVFAYSMQFAYLKNIHLCAICLLKCVYLFGYIYHLEHTIHNVLTLFGARVWRRF